MVARVVALVVGALCVSPSMAQDLAGRPLPTDLRLPVSAPLEATLIGFARLARVPVGFEAVPERNAVPPVDGRSNFSSPKIGTVGEALDAILAPYPSYRWQAAGQIAIVRPVTHSDRQNSSILDRRLETFEVSRVDFGTALRALHSQLAFGSGRILPGRPWVSTQGARLISVTLKDCTVMDALNGIVAAHGELMWTVIYGEVEGQSRVSIALRAFDGATDEVTLGVPGSRGWL